MTLSVMALNTVLSVINKSIMLSVIMLSVVMVSVMALTFQV